jgi:hypothetical protein
MADWKSTQRSNGKPLPTIDPKRIIQEVAYRDRRIVYTDDPKLVGSQHPDKWGFTCDRGFVVLDDFDENVLPIGMHWFFTADDAAAAIEMLDLVLPTIKEDQPCTTLLYEYGLLRSYRREFGSVYHTIVMIQKDIDDAAAFEENPAESIKKRLHLLRQNAAQGKGIG